jgi:hypothetical protein
MTVIHMPINTDDAEYIDMSGEDGYFWKQLIPMNYSLDYKGKKLLFDEQYLRNIKKAYEENALGQQTAFQLASDANEHDTAEDRALGRNYDPRRFHGDVSQLAVNSRGLYGRFKLTKDGTKLISDNPKLGVSVSLKEGYKSHNGKEYPVVMRHVLGTLDPKIRSMGDWQKDLITLTDDAEDEVIDLTTAVPQKTEGDNGQNKDGQSTDTAALQAELERLRGELKEYQDAEATIDEWMNAEDDDDEESEDSTVNQSIPVDPKLIQLSNEVAEARWEKTKAEYLGRGVPRKMLDLCDEVMSDGYSDNTIQLSNSKTVDPKELIKAVLREAEGLVDLSEEHGHSVPNEEKTAETEYIDNFMREYF